MKTLSRLGCFAASLVFLSLSASASAGSESVQAFKDPVTGKLRAPTAEEAKALRQAPQPMGQRSVLSPRASIMPNAPRAIRSAQGAVGMQLPDSFMSYSVVTRDANGKLEEHCVTGEKAAEAVMTAQPRQENADETE